MSKVSEIKSTKVKGLLYELGCSKHTTLKRAREVIEENRRDGQVTDKEQRTLFYNNELYPMSDKVLEIMRGVR